MSIILAIAALATPADRPFILAETDRPLSEISACVAEDWEDQGVSDVTPTDYGQRVDFRYSNLGGAVKEPTVSMEIHEGVRRALLVYGFKSWKGAIKGVWSHTAKKCFPEIRDTPVTKR